MKKIQIKCKIKASALFIFAISFLLLDSSTVLATLCALLLHEGAHLIAIVLLGSGKCRVELTPFGGIINAKDFSFFHPMKQLVIALSGVGVSFITALCCFKGRSLLAHEFFLANASLAAVNLLPCLPLDGARILISLAIMRGKERIVRLCLSWSSGIFAVLFLLLGLYGVWHGVVNISLLAVGPYLLYATYLEKIAYRVRALAVQKKKSDSGIVLPANVYCTDSTTPVSFLAPIISRLNEDRYHLFVRIDPETKRILCIQSEEQVMHQLLELEGTDIHKT